MLMTGNATGHVYWGMGLNLVVTALVIALGIVWQAPGVPAAAAALTLGMTIELVYLAWRVRPVQMRLQMTLNPAGV